LKSDSRLNPIFAELITLGKLKEKALLSPKESWAFWDSIS
jgi:hypothetical protein